MNQSLAYPDSRKPRFDQGFHNFEPGHGIENSQIGGGAFESARNAQMTGLGNPAHFSVVFGASAGRGYRERHAGQAAGMVQFVHEGRIDVAGSASAFAGHFFFLEIGRFDHDSLLT